MSSSSSFLRRHSKPSVLLPALTLIRSMGGGPRTFKGGLSKWQHKRMHEKLARDKERKLLHQEKQLYQARLRSEIRANAAGATFASSSSAFQQPSSFGPMTSKDHIKALADRFMKAGAEDLWNRDDGPLRSSLNRDRDQTLRPPPLDPRKSISQHQHQQRREYSRWRRNESSDSNDEDDAADWGAAGGTKLGKGTEFLKLGSRKEMRSGAALRNRDVKRETKRVLKEGDWKERIRELREEVRYRPDVLGAIGRKREEARGSVLTQRRFDECNISPLTIKALNEAGYVNMTVAQDAALPLCLEGKDALVKARTGTGKSAAFLF